MRKERALLGKQVRITLSLEPFVTAEGRLLAIDEGGEATLVAEDGFARYCWPVLEIEEVPGQVFPPDQAQPLP